MQRFRGNISTWKRPAETARHSLWGQSALKLYSGINLAFSLVWGNPPPVCQPQFSPPATACMPCWKWKEQATRWVMIRNVKILLKSLTHFHFPLCYIARDYIWGYKRACVPRGVTLLMQLLACWTVSGSWHGRARAQSVQGPLYMHPNMFCNPDPAYSTLPPGMDRVWQRFCGR